MATITAALTVSSDISSYGGPSINKTMTMTKAATNNGLERTSGIQRKYMTSANHIDLIQGAAGVVADMTVSATASAAKIYIKYLEADTSKHVTLGFGTSSGGGTQQANDSTTTPAFELGKLYGDDWMIIPWDGTSATGDITVKPSSASAADPAIIEYIVFFD
tara:strand:- start:3173 stop:3658 length:486 start_codon:yes stop_codon:yes gene_type:complete